jgi:uncharacterized membrane protein
MNHRIAAPPRPRIESVDLVRGVIMIVMALDHVRDYLGLREDPTNVATTTVALFFTRWITHFCAPVFFLLTGTSARLSLGRRTKRELSRFLWTRGLWLIVLDTIVLRCLAYQFNFDFHVTLLIVLWALGWSMIALSALIYLPAWGLGIVGALLIAGHNLLDDVPAQTFGAWAPLWSILHAPGMILGPPGRVVFETYPLIPWIGVTALGWLLGAAYAWPAARRQALLLRLGIALTAAFVALRAWNGYGDPARWGGQDTIGRTMLSFLNTTKYPPSLLFLCMTLGPALIFLRLAEAPMPRWLAPARIIGKVPMFYYLVHFPLIHVVAVIVCELQFGTIHGMFESPGLAQYPVTFPPGWGLALPGVYLVWLGIMAMVYPLCRWFAGLKQRRRDWWLSYL